MIDSAVLGAVVDECAAGAAELVVEGDGCCEGEEALQDALSEPGSPSATRPAHSHAHHDHGEGLQATGVAQKASGAAVRRETEILERQRPLNRYGRFSVQKQESSPPVLLILCDCERVLVTEGGGAGTSEGYAQFAVVASTAGS
jgi:hypothetical protein